MVFCVMIDYSEVAKILDCREETVFEVQEDATPAVVEASSGTTSSTTSSVDVSSSSSQGLRSSSSIPSKHDSNNSLPALITAPQRNEDGEEIVLARTKIWQPLERCRQVSRLLHSRRGRGNPTGVAIYCT